MLTRLLFSLLIILCYPSVQVFAKSSFGAQQNVEGMENDNGQPNVVMQSVVFGKNGSKKKNWDYSTDDGDENEMEDTLRKFYKLICPSMCRKTEEDDFGYPDDCSNNFDNMKVQRLLKMYKSKKRKLKKYDENTTESSEEGDVNKQHFGRYQRRREYAEAPFNRRWRKKDKYFMPLRSRPRVGTYRLQSRKCFDELEESTELNDNMKSEEMNKAFDWKNNLCYVGEDENQVESDDDNRAFYNRPASRFGRRRKYNVPASERQKFDEYWRHERCNDLTSEDKVTTSRVPQDILYIPQIDKPIRRRNRFSETRPDECYGRY